MTKPTQILLLSVLMTGLGSVAHAQLEPMLGRSGINFSLGFWGGSAGASSTIGYTGIRTEAGTSGFSGYLGYEYWLRENLALTLNFGLRSAKVTALQTSSNDLHEASAVFPFLLGVHFDLLSPGPDENIRPYLSLAVGPYIGAEAANTALAREAHVESTVGFRPGLGIDFLLGNHFKLGAEAGYHLTGTFSSEIGGRRNANGGEFCMIVGIVF